LFRLLIPVVPSIDIENIFTLILPLALLIAGIILGLLFYPLTVPKKRRIAEPFIGGEVQSEDMRPSGTEFYNTVKDLKFLRSMYHAAERKTLDLYEVCKSITMYFSEGFRSLHSGILGTYLTWILFGLITLLYVFLRW